MIGHTLKRAILALLAVTASTGIAAAADDLLEKVKERGVLRVCHAEYNPWNVKNPATNKWEGINIDIVNLIAEQLKVEVEDVDATFGTVILNLTTDRCDLAAPAFYVSAARAELVSFTNPFAEDGTTIYVSKKLAATTFEELDKPGIVVVVRSGSYEEPIAKRIFKQATVKVLTADGTSIQLLEIAAGRADAALGSYFGNLHFLKQNPNMEVRLLNDELLTKQSIAYAVPPREYFMRDYLNAAIMTLRENGKIQEILDKWFQ